MQANKQKLQNQIAYNIRHVEIQLYDYNKVQAPPNFECLEDGGVWGVRWLYEKRAVDALGTLAGAYIYQMSVKRNINVFSTHVQLCGFMGVTGAGWIYWPQKVILSMLIRKFSTSEPSPDLSTPVREPQSETKR